MNASNKHPVSFAHHWLITMRGGERVLEELMRPFPGAQLYTLLSAPERISKSLRQFPIHNSFLQVFPNFLKERYRYLLPLFPTAARFLHLPESTRLLITSDAALIKTIHNPSRFPHVCYCYSPPRYLWEMSDEYTSQTSSMSPLSKTLFKLFTPYLKAADFQAAQSVDHFIGISQFVQQRIKKYYNRDAEIIYPFVAVDSFTPTCDHDGYYLVLSHLVPYKRVDLAVQAFNRLGKKLVVVGTGPELPFLKKIAHSNIHFLGHQSFPELIRQTERCRALIFPGTEDFGITPLEAQAAGKPVIAYQAGGALETVIEDETGLFFDHQDPESLVAAVERLEAREHRFSPVACRHNAERFRPQVFREQWLSFLNTHYPDLIK